MTSAAGGYQYAYTNPIPGSYGGQAPGQVPDNVVVAEGPKPPELAPFTAPVQSDYQVSQSELNPAYNPKTEFESGAEELGAGMQNPEAPEPPGAEDRAGDDPGVNEDRGDEETDLRGYGEGDVTGGGLLAGGGTEYEPNATTEPPSV